jgi:hypothetical protein
VDDAEKTKIIRDGYMRIYHLLPIDDREREIKKQKESIEVDDA